MLPTGDVQGCLRKLETLLRVVKYPGHVDYNGLSKGDPSAFLPILSFILTTFSPPFAEQLVAAGLELTGKTDLRFTDTLYKVLQNIFHYKPILSKQQFLQRGFVQRKISILCDVIELVLKRHRELNKPRVRNHVSHKGTRGNNDTKPTKPITTIVQAVHDEITTSERGNTNLTEKKLKEDHIRHHQVVVHHKQQASTLSSQTIVQAVHDEVTTSENGNTNLTEEKQEEDHIQHHSSKIEQRLSVMEVQLKSLLCGLQKLSALEDRLEELASRTNTEKKEEELITISRESWENLNGRILLLETKLELGHTKSSIVPQCESAAQFCSFSSISDASQNDIKDRLERITNMLKTTSTLMKSTDSSTTSYK